MPILAELKRRNVIRMAGLYLVGAWLVVQVASTILPLFDAPAWLPRSVVLLLAIGFVPALVLSWVFELTPAGLKREVVSSAEAPPAPRSARRMDRLIMVVLSISLVYFAVDKFVLAPRRATADAVPAQDTLATRAPAPATDAATPPAVTSIAVLPFANTSGVPDNVYFADGLSEEILNSLSRLDGLQVIGRASSFQFKDRDEDPRVIGRKLGVGAVLDGSVRRDGNRARITAQLVRTRDGVNLWSQSYDRTLDDILAVQLDIAEQVAGALHVVLDQKQRQRMRDAGVSNVEAFVAYQKGLKLYADAHDATEASAVLAGLADANRQFELATRIEPGLGTAYYMASDRDEHLVLAEHTRPAERAAALQRSLAKMDQAIAAARDPRQRLFIEIDRQLLSDDWRGLGARIDQALAASGCHESNWLSQFAVGVGLGARYLPAARHAIACNPLATGPRIRLAEILNHLGQPQQALAAVQAADRAGVRSSTLQMQAVRALAALHRFDEAQAVLAATPKNGEFVAAAHLALATEQGQAPAAVLAELRKFDRQHTRFDTWSGVDLIGAALTGQRADANRRAAEIDARPSGSLYLALVTDLCQCGAPFDLSATPNFRRHLAQAGLTWKPTGTLRP